MPWSLYQRWTNQSDTDTWTWHHPMERDTHLYAEMTFAITMLHMPYDRYLAETSDEMRTLNFYWWNLRNSKEAYWATPKDQRFGFFARRV